MPSLDIATAQTSFQNHFSRPRAQAFSHGRLSSNFTFTNAKRFGSASKSFQVPYKDSNTGHLETRRDQGQFLIKAVATLETGPSVKNKDGQKGRSNPDLDISSSPMVHQNHSSIEDSSEVNEREKLRRMRISKANKGNTPWNKGRKHSPETLRRIKERTRLAMQDPKVKMKLINLGHAQSEETRVKIGVGVRMGWQRRREKLMLQETFYFQWENLIAEASRKGFLGENGLRWDSYQIWDEQHQQEWLKSIEERKKIPKPIASKRAPKSLEQRRKISQAISAKWTDPGYRDRVCSALAKFHGVPDGVERKPRRRPNGDSQSRRRSSANKSSDMYASVGSETKSQSLRIRMKRNRGPRYKDPLASSKLQMIKNIRADRAAAETKKTEAIEQARLLIAEAEKAAKALEVAAMRSPLARASLVETRKLINEAIRSIESINAGIITSHGNSGDQYASNGLINLVNNETVAGVKGLNGASQSKVNGTQVLDSSSHGDSYFSNFTLQNLLNDEEEHLPTSSNEYVVPWLHSDNLAKQSDSKSQMEVLTCINYERFVPLNGAMREETSTNLETPNKKWIRGRLVDVAEED